MSNNNITTEQQKVIDTLHNLVWHRITHDDQYLESIPEIDSRDFHNYIYYIRYEFLEYEDSVLQAIVYLNGVEVVRTNMPLSGVTYTTLATRAIYGVEEGL